MKKIALFILQATLIISTITAQTYTGPQSTKIFANINGNAKAPIPDLQYTYISDFNPWNGGTYKEKIFFIPLNDKVQSITTTNPSDKIFIDNANVGKEVTINLVCNGKNGGTYKIEDLVNPSSTKWHFFYCKPELRPYIKLGTFTGNKGGSATSDGYHKECRRGEGGYLSGFFSMDSKHNTENAYPPNDAKYFKNCTTELPNFESYESYITAPDNYSYCQPVALINNTTLQFKMKVQLGVFPIWYLGGIERRPNGSEIWYSDYRWNKWSDCDKVQALKEGRKFAYTEIAAVGPMILPNEITDAGKIYLVDTKGSEVPCLGSTQSEYSYLVKSTELNNVYCKTITKPTTINGNQNEVKYSYSWSTSGSGGPYKTDQTTDLFSTGLSLKTVIGNNEANKITKTSTLKVGTYTTTKSCYIYYTKVVASPTEITVSGVNKGSVTTAIHKLCGDISKGIKIKIGSPQFQINGMTSTNTVVNNNLYDITYTRIIYLNNEQIYTQDSKQTTICEFTATKKGKYTSDIIVTIKNKSNNLTGTITYKNFQSIELKDGVDITYNYTDRNSTISIVNDKCYFTITSKNDALVNTANITSKDSKTVIIQYWKNNSTWSAISNLNKSTCYGYSGYVMQGDNDSEITFTTTGLPCYTESDSKTYKVTIPIYRPLEGGTLKCLQNNKNTTTICPNQDFTLTTNTPFKGGKIDKSNITYQWYIKNSVGSYEEIAGATSETLTIINGITQKTTYMRRVYHNDIKGLDSYQNNSLTYTPLEQTIEITPYSTFVLPNITISNSSATEQTLPQGQYTIKTQGGTSAGGFIYRWMKDEQKIEGQQSSSYTFNLTNTVTYKVTIGDQCVNTDLTQTSDHYNKTIKIIAQVNAGAITPTKTTICQGDQVTLNNTQSATGGTSIKYEWYKVENGVETLISGATESSLTLTPTKSTTLYRRAIDSNQSANRANTEAITIEVKVPMTADTDLPEEICYGDHVGAVTITAQGGSGQGYTYTLMTEGSGEDQLFESNTTGIFADIQDYNSAERTYIYKIVDKGNICPSITKRTNVKGTGQFIVGRIAPEETLYLFKDQPLNLTDPYHINSTTSNPRPIGGSGSYQYQWQIQQGGGEWTDVNEETTPIYKPKTFNQTTKIRLQVTDAICGAKETENEVIVNIKTLPDFKIITSNNQTKEDICYNTKPRVLKVQSEEPLPTDKYAYQWYTSSDNNQYDIMLSETRDTLELPQQTRTQWIQLRINEKSNPTEYKQAIEPYLIAVKEPLNAGEITCEVTDICDNNDPRPITNKEQASGGFLSGINQYKWYKSTNEKVDYTIIEGEASPNYNPGATLSTGTTYYKRQIIDNCSNESNQWSNVIALTKFNKLTPGKIIPQSQEIEQYDTLSLNTTPAQGGVGEYTYRWYIKTGKGDYIQHTTTTPDYPTIRVVDNLSIYRRVEDSKCGNTNTDTIAIKMLPYIEIEGQKALYCKGDEARISIKTDCDYIIWEDINKKQIGRGTTITITSITQDTTIYAYLYDDKGELTHKSIRFKIDNIAADFSVDQPSLIYGQAIQFTNQSTGAIRYEWNFGDQSESSEEENPWHYYNDEGRYTVTLTAESKQGCKETKEKQNYIQAISYDNIQQLPNQASHPMILPNPTKGIVKIETDEAIDNITLTTPLGEDHPQNSKEIDLTNYPSGLYIIRYTTQGNTTHQHKVIKQ